MTPEEMHKKYRDKHKDIINLSNGLYRYGLRIPLKEIRANFDGYKEMYNNLIRDRKAKLEVNYPERQRILEYHNNKKKLFSEYKETLEVMGIDTKKITYEKAKKLIFGETHPEQFNFGTLKTKKQIFETNLELAKQSISIAQKNINL